MNDLSKQFGVGERLKYRVIAALDLIITAFDLMVLIVSLNAMSSVAVVEEKVDWNLPLNENATAMDTPIANKLTDISTGTWIATAIIIVILLFRIGLCLGMLIAVPLDASQMGDMLFATWCTLWIFLLTISGFLFLFVFREMWYAVGISTVLRILCFFWAYKIYNPSEGFCNFLCFLPVSCFPLI